MTTVTTHSELNRLALKNGLDSAYVVWLSLRQAILSDGHSGHFTRENAYQQSINLGLNFSRRNFNRIILQGAGLFWGTDTEKIYMRSFDRIYKSLADDSALANRNPVTVKITLYKSLAKRRAELYWSWFAARQETTIARETITELFNLSPDQQRAYDEILGKRLIVHTNYCHIDADNYGQQLLNLPKHHFSFLQENFADNKVTYTNVVAYQLPNTYFARPSKRGESPLAKTPRRHLRCSRTLYRLTDACSPQQRYYHFWDEYEVTGTLQDYIRTGYQGTKHIYRQGQYF